MSNEPRPRVNRITRAMHRAAAALYSAGFEREREEPPTPGNSQTPEPEGGVVIASNQTVPDLSPVQHDEGGSTEEATRVQDIGDQGISDSSGEAQR